MQRTRATPLHDAHPAGCYPLPMLEIAAHPDGMPSEAESAVVAFFHLARSAGKKDRNGWQSDRIAEQILRKAMRRQALRRLEDAAERDAWERALE